jgi:hypothetical protein
VRLHRDDHLARHCQRVDGEQPEARRAVEQHVVEVVLGGLELLLEDHLAAEHRDQLDLGGREVDRAGDKRDPVVDLVDGLEEALVLDEDVVQRAHLGRRLDAVVDREVCLGVEVDEADALPELGQGRAEVDRGGGLPDPALLVHQGDYASHRAASLRESRYACVPTRFSGIF